MLCRKHSICHFERAEGESRNLFLSRFLRFVPMNRDFGRNDSESFLQSKIKTCPIDKLKANAVDMEGAAVAQICYQRKIPHLVIRSISDKGDQKAREDSTMFQEMAAKNSASFIVEIVGLLDSML